MEFPLENFTSGFKYVQCFKSYQFESTYLNCHEAFLHLAQLEQSKR